MEQSSFFEQVYQLVRKIPKGKVMTYGDVARMLGSRDARKVGWALHANSDPETPCHRVVDKSGRVAPNFASDGWEEQKRRLEAEGVTFIDDMHMDLTRHLWKP